MKAAVITGYGAPPEVQEVETPVAGEGQEAVTVELAGLNPLDVAIASGKFDAGAPPLPYVTGTEGVGTGPDGRRIWFDQAQFPHGSIAGHSLIAAGSGIEVPDGTDSAQAVAFGIAGLAAWLSLEWRGTLQPGETVVVLGASGAVGQLAVQAARLLGAGRVVGAARSASGRAKVESLGADAVVDTDPDGLTEALREATGGGADLVVDCLWGEPARAAIAAIKPSGRLVQVGNSASPSIELKAGPLRGGFVSILGHRNFWAPHDEKARAFTRMCEHAAEGELTIEVEVTPIDEIAGTWARQAASPGHKLAVSPAA